MKEDKKLQKKYKLLRRKIAGLESAVVAFSGGVDSSFLLHTTFSVLGNKNVLAVIADSPTYTKKELKSAQLFSRWLGIKHMVIKTDELKNPQFAKNPLNRCYFCKRELFSKLKDIAKKKGCRAVIDGQNFDDKKDFRPGSIAAAELGVRSPLKETAFRKQDIRKISKQLGLSVWDKPSLACLSSRFPYGNRITEKYLLKIQKAEDFLYKLKFKNIRVRHYGKLCRIEVDKNQVKRLFQRRAQDKIIAAFKKLGYTYVTVDLEGYRTGSMNETLK